MSPLLIYFYFYARTRGDEHARLLEVSAVVGYLRLLLYELHSLVRQVSEACSQLCFLCVSVESVCCIVCCAGTNDEHTRVALNRLTQCVLADSERLSDNSRLHAGIAETVVSQSYAINVLNSLT